MYPSRNKVDKKIFFFARKVCWISFIAFILIIMLFYLVSLLDYGLQFNSKLNVKKTVGNISKPIAEIPPLPKEQWEYIDSLPKRKVEVEPRKQILSQVSYIMQCGAYKTLKQAKARKLDIAFHGIQSNIHKKKDSSLWYCVVLGPYELKRHAERDRHRLQRNKIEPCEIWKARIK
ncbi:cell division protein [Candidatus Photodesmus katoptron]|uniref:Sporulation related protein n=1 Tax=Candidatus Photodesmus katoptron Akat1 TaxID=1236703 RepID=S3EGY5_9GAMM|nr:SPOR domain-containing protein [Candidatus Photodesmus katoptron]EPE37428.1 sporulation related protein [Candidatus Photodesmus katoptron Akat1]KEY90155.1 cell division protein [Candidatus Photodesmus katoptron]